MEKLICSFRAQNKSRPYGFLQVTLHYLLRVLVNRCKQGEVRAIAQTSKVLQGFLRLDWQAVQLSDHEIHHIVGVAFGVNAIDVPGPPPGAVIERQQRFLCKRVNELNRKKWISGSLLVNQLREWCCALRFAVNGIHDQLAQILTAQGLQADFL